MMKLTEDMIGEIREKYEVPAKYSSYIMGDKIFHRFDKKAKPRYAIFRTDDDEQEYTCYNQGYYKGTYFILVKVTYDVDFGDQFEILFTDDIGRFFKTFMKGKPKPLPKPLIVKPGLFEIMHTMFGAVFRPVTVGKTMKPILNDDLYEQLDSEIMAFLEKEEVYDSMNMEYKRGILFYGDPGNGKTSFIKHYLKGRKDFISILVNIRNPDDLEVISDLLEIDNYDKYLKVIVIEDIDGMSVDVRSDILNFLDGMKRMRKVLFIATTNYPDKIDHALKKRPSRFDSVIKIDVPNSDSRMKLLKHYFKKSISDSEMKRAVEESSGFSGAYFKEIYILSRLNDQNACQSIKTIKQRFELFNGE